MDRLELVVVKNPFNRGQREVRHAEYTQQSIQTLILEQLPIGIDYHVSINGQLIEPSSWGVTYPCAGDQITVVTALQGGGGGKNILRTVLMVVVAVAAAYVGSLGTSGFWLGGGTTSVTGSAALGGLMGAATMIAGGMLVNALVPAPQLNLAGASDFESSPSYSWNPQMTQRQGLVVPKWYGKIRVSSGNIIASHLEAVGEDQYVNALISYGFGPIKGLSDVYLNNQPLANYDDAGLGLHERRGWINQSLVPNFNDTKVEDVRNLLISSTASETYTSGVAGTDFDSLELEFTCPQGLWHANNSGGMDSVEIRLEVKMRISGSSDPYVVVSETSLTDAFSYVGYARWEYGYYIEYTRYAREESFTTYRWHLAGTGSVAQEDHVEGEAYASNSRYIWHWNSTGENISSSIGQYIIMQSNKTNPLRRVLKIPSGLFTVGNAYEIVITKLTADYNDTKYGDTVNLSIVREVEETDFEYPRSVLYGIRALATDQLSGSLSVSVLGEWAIVNTFNGSTWTLQWSNNPAWVCYDILTQPVISGNSLATYAVERYDGIDPSRLDYAKFYEWAEYCDELVTGASGQEVRSQFDGGFDAETSMWEAALQVCEVGRAMLLWNGTSISVHIDKPASPVQLFSMGNIVKDSFSETFLSQTDRISEIEIDFINAENDYNRDRINIINPNITNLTNKTSLSLKGVTRYSEAYRLAMLKLNYNQTIPRTLTWSSSIDALACQIGDVVYIQHDVPQWGTGGRVESNVVGGNSVTLDQTVTIEDAKTYQLTIRHNDDTVTTYSVTNIAGNTAVITTGSVISDDISLCNYAFGEILKDKKPVRIIGISRGQDQDVNITAIDYNDSVYNIDTNTPVVDTHNYSDINNYASVSNIAIQESTILTHGFINTQLTLTWQNDENVKNCEVWYSVNSSSTFLGTFFDNAVLDNILSGTTYRFYVVPMNHVGQKEPKSAASYIDYTTSSTPVIPTDVDYMLTGVDNLRVFNAVSPGVFNSRDCIIAWDAPSHVDGKYKWLKNYVVDIYSDGTKTTLLKSETTLIETYTFSFDTNTGVTGGPVRSFFAEVYCVDLFGNTGLVQNLTVSNPQPGAVSGVSFVTRYGLAEISWTALTDLDLAGYEIHISSSPGFTPSAGTLYTTAPKEATNIHASDLTDGNWYVRIGGYDIFSRLGMSYSTEDFFTLSSAITATDLTGFPEELSSVYSSPILEADTWTNSLGTTLGWNAHSLWYQGVEYSIALGSTTDAYIYWSYPNTTYSTTDDVEVFKALQEENDDFQIAINYGDSYELGWDSRANMIIGTAKIGNLAVQNTQIADVIESTSFSATNPAEGWQLDKNGVIRGREIQILNSDGSVLLGAATDLDYSHVNNGPPADADVTEYNLHSIGSDEIVLDGDMEVADLTYWIQANCVISKSATQVKFDTQSLLLIATAAQSCSAYQKDSDNSYLYFSVEPGQTIYVSGYVYSELGSGDGTALVGLMFDNATHTSKSWAQEYVTTENVWEYVSGSFVVPAGKYWACPRVGAGASNTGGNAYFDRVSCRRSQNSADVTSDHQSASTALVGSTAAALVESNAANALSATDAMVSDAIFSKQEKLTWQYQWPGMDKNYDSIIAQATTYGIQAESVFTTFTTRRNTLNTFLVTTHDINNATLTDSALNGTTFKDNVTNFYDSMQLAINRIAEYTRLADVAGVGDLAGQDRSSLLYTDGADVTANSAFVTTTYPADQSAIQTQIDGKIISWFTGTDPSLSWSGTDAQHEGDMWWNSSTNKLKRWSGTAWSGDIEDQKAIDAYTNAGNAQDTADEKRRVFVSTPTVPYDVGDLWDRGSILGIWRCITASATSYNLSHWQVVADHTKDNLAGAGVNILPAKISYWNGTTYDFTSKSNNAIPEVYGFAYFGSKSFRIQAIGTDAWVHLDVNAANIYPYPISPNKKWIFSAYVRHNAIANADGQAYIRTNSTGAFHKVSFQTSATIGEWTRISGVLDLTADPSIAFNVRLDNDAGSGYLYFDGLMLEELIGNITTPSAYSCAGSEYAILPASGADVTGSNTSLNTTNVGSTAAATVEANAANALQATDAMADDLVFSASEKLIWQYQWPGMLSNYTSIFNAATTKGINAEAVFTNFTAAKTDLNTFLVTTHSINANPTTDSVLTAGTFTTKVTSFYDTMQLAVNRLAEYTLLSDVDGAGSLAGQDSVAWGSADISSQPTDDVLLNYLIPSSQFNGVELPYANQPIYIPCKVETAGTPGWYKVFECPCQIAFSATNFDGVIRWGSSGGRYTAKCAAHIALVVSNPETSLSVYTFKYAGDNPTPVHAYRWQDAANGNRWVLSIYVYLNAWSAILFDGKWLTRHVDGSWINDNLYDTDGVAAPNGLTEIPAVQDYDIGATVGAIWSSNISGQPTDTELLNENTTPSDIGFTGDLDADKTANVIGGIASTSFPDGVQNTKTTKEDVGLPNVVDGATIGATWGSNITGQPTSLSGINSTEGNKLGGIADGADVTSANKAFGLDRPDTRSVDSPPSHYYGLGRGKYVEFKLRSVISAPGTGTYVSLTTEVPWQDISGGAIIQTCSNGPDLSRRHSTSNTTWSTWTTIADGADVTGDVVGGLASTSFPSGVQNTNTTKADVGLPNVTDGATVGATWGTDITGQPSDTVLLNENTTPADIGYTGDLDADKTATAISATVQVTSGGLRITNTANSDYVELTPGGFRCNNGSINVFEYTNGAITMRGATSGERLEITNNIIRVYDASNVLRVKLGDLT